MKSETLLLANMGLEDFKDTINRILQDPQYGQLAPFVRDPKVPLWDEFFGLAAGIELFEGVRTITYQIREKQNGQLIATVDVKRIHLKGVPLHPDRFNGLRVRIGWTEPALNFARSVLHWLDRHIDVELPAWLVDKDAQENESNQVEEETVNRI